MPKYSGSGKKSGGSKSIPINNAPPKGGTTSPEGYQDSRPTNSDRKQSAR